MFTGLVQALGRIAAVEPIPAGRRFRIAAGDLAADARLGDSVAVNGCCLTVVRVDGDTLDFDAIPETLDRTALGGLGAGDAVNLELPLRPQDRLGGHFVQGHVDAVTELLAIHRDGGGVVHEFALPEALRGQIVAKGSVALDGVSLTVAAADADTFRVALIPHTLEVTTFGRLAVHDRVNVEGDILAKYVAALVPAR